MALIKCLECKNSISNKAEKSNGYIHVVKWSCFKQYPNLSISKAIECINNTPTYKIVKTI